MMRMIDATLSKFNPHSEISDINSGRADSVSQAFVDVFDLSWSVCSLSGGVFDPTVGPVCELWGFGRKDFDTIPEEETIQKALALVGIRDCSISGGRVIKKDPGTEFDFSSVAKGYGIDCIKEMFDRNGVASYMIEIGGEIAAKGYSPRKKPWRIQIDAPIETEDPSMLHSRLTAINLGPEPEAIATSGNYRNTRRSGNISFGHTISPITGRPAESKNVSVTIIAPTCALADAVATACMALPGPEEALCLVEKTGVKALIVYSDQDSVLKIASSPEFKQLPE